jgi:hypothetical protein
MIELVDETRVRGAVEHHYRAKARPDVTAAAWAKAPAVAKQAAVGSSLDVIGEYARVSAAAGGFDRSEAQLRRAIVKVDERGFEQLSKACEKLLEQVEKIQAASAERIRTGKSEAVETGLGVLLFEAAQLTPSGGGSGSRRGGRAPRARR